jgi:hypothetical protein
MGQIITRTSTHDFKDRGVVQVKCEITTEPFSVSVKTEHEGFTIDEGTWDYDTFLDGLCESIATECLNRSLIRKPIVVPQVASGLVN